MQRSTGLFLFAVGCVFVLLAAFGLIQAADAGRAGDTIFWVFLILKFVGLALLAAGLFVMRGARPIGAAPKVTEGRAGNYLADVTEERSYAGRAYEVHYQAPVRGKKARPSSLTVRVEAGTPT